MEIIKAGLIIITFLYILVGFSSPKSLSGECDSCDAYLTPKDSLVISSAFQDKIDSFAIQKQEQLDCINDSVCKIEAKLKHESRSQRPSSHTQGKR